MVVHRLDKKIATENPDTIAARLTAAMPSAIATIAVRGEGASDIVLSCASLKTTRLDVGRVHYGTWTVTSTDSERESCSEQVVVCRTSQNQVELHCHGGNAICKAILSSLSACGCRVIPVQDWPSEYRCPISRAAEQDLLRASTDKAAAALIDQLNGALARAISWTIALLQPDNLKSDDLRSDDTAEAEQTLLKLQSWSDFGQHLAEPWRIVFAGPPNVGKSSLTNAIVGQSRSIVHPDAGTTRDWVESQTAIAGWPVSLTDTAGIRDSRDRIEVEGIRRAQERIEQADLVVLVVDATQGWTVTHDELAAADSARKIVAWNKADLVAEAPKQLHSKLRSLLTSSIGAPGIDDLLQTIAEALIPVSPIAGTAIPFRQSHTDHIATALEYLQTGDPRSAIAQLERLGCNGCAAEPPGGKRTTNGHE